MRVLRGLAAMLALATLSFVAVGARESRAVAAPCFAGAQRIGLTPTGAVTLDGLSLQRSTTTGRYQTDGGLDFDVNATELDAVEPPGAACVSSATTLTLRVNNPFTGATSTLSAVTP